MSTAVHDGDLLAARVWIARAHRALARGDRALAAACLSAASAYTREVANVHADRRTDGIATAQRGL